MRRKEEDKKKKKKKKKPKRFHGIRFMIIPPLDISNDSILNARLFR